MKFKMVQSFGVIFLLAVCLQISTFGQLEKSSNEITKNLKIYLKKAEAYGFSGQVLIAEKGKVLLDQAYGLADRERNIPNSPATVFSVASLTKQLTATGILRLETDGKLKTSDTIDQYLENVPADKARITIHQLLTHTSGLARGDGGRNNTTREETLAKILQAPLIAKIGEKFIYSNNGYHLLAAIIEKLTGQTYPQYITEKLFKPAGMRQSGFYQDEHWKQDLIAHSYNEWTKLPAFTEWNKGWNYGSGSIVSTSSDLYKWFAALRENKILPPEETEKLFTKHNIADDDGVFYGYGWFIEKLENGKTLVYHGGDIAGYHSEFRWYAEDNRVIIILTNYELLEPDGVAIQKRVIANNLNRILKGEEYKQPPIAVKLSAKDLKRFEGEYRAPNGEKLKIWSNGVYLEIGAEGQEIINAIAGYENETAKKYAAANDLTKFILESLAKGAQETIKSRIAKAEYDFYIPFLIQQFEEFQKTLGAVNEIKVQGTTSFPWDQDNYRTNVILRFEKGSTDLFLGYRNGKLSDVTTETGRPFPLIMPFAANSKSQFATFEFLRSKLTQFSFRGKNLIVKTKTGALTAHLISNAK